MAVEDAHNVCDWLAHALREEGGEAVITIHVKPPQKTKQSGVVIL
jgi:divalent metal cation (Fe/Co/Zn/Cd) transporter